ncbi:MAG TPA: hypothetical protein VEC36_04030 [Patescibacteria group bacterium]|nr:hypothetical protein [Patescibacteria group bacterium]
MSLAYLNSLALDKNRILGSYNLVKILYCLYTISGERIENSLTIYIAKVSECCIIKFIMA